MKNKFQEYKNAIIGNTLTDILKFFFGYLVSTGIFTYVASILIKYYHLLQFKWYLIIFVFAGASWIFLELYTRLSRKFPSLPAVNCGYTLLRREVFFEYGRSVSKYTTKLKIKSEQDGLDRYHGKYAWTGSGKAQLVAGKRSQEIVELVRKDSYIDYELMFGQTYNKGKIFDITITAEMPDPNGTFVPFFTSQVLQPTNYLSINISIPPEYGVREIICEQFVGERNGNTVVDTVLLDRHGEYVWNIKNPKLFYCYSIRWCL